MKFALGVKVVKAFEDLAQNYCYVMFFKRASFHEIECRSTTKILHYYPQHRVLHASTKTTRTWLEWLHYTCQQWPCSRWGPLLSVSKSPASHLLTGMAPSQSNMMRLMRPLVINGEQRPMIALKMLPAPSPIKVWRKKWVQRQRHSSSSNTFENKIDKPIAAEVDSLSNTVCPHCMSTFYVSCWLLLN